MRDTSTEHVEMIDVAGTRLHFVHPQSSQIMAVTLDGRTWRLGEKVYARGVIFAEAGTMGLIINIARPHHEDRTTNVLDVFFEGQTGISKMKPRDLQR